MKTKIKLPTETQIGVLHNLAHGLYELYTFSGLRKHWMMTNLQTGRGSTVLPSTVKALADRGYIVNLPPRHADDFMLRVGITEAGREALAAYHEREG